jgi:hypothetical protein
MFELTEVNKSMSAPICIAFYGVRFELSQNEIESLEERSDQRLAAARKNGHKHYWGNFGLPGEKWLLFIGASLGKFGVEGQSDAEFDKQSLQSLMAETESKLRQAGFDQVPKFYLQWQED